jgi:hypothetical protein
MQAAADKDGGWMASAYEALLFTCNQVVSVDRGDPRNPRHPWDARSPVHHVAVSRRICEQPRHGVPRIIRDSRIGDNISISTRSCAHRRLTTQIPTSNLTTEEHRMPPRVDAFQRGKRRVPTLAESWQAAAGRPRSRFVVPLPFSTKASEDLGKLKRQNLTNFPAYRQENGPLDGRCHAHVTGNGSRAPVMLHTA